MAHHSSTIAQRAAQTNHLVRRCRNDVDTGGPEDCIAELVERAARVRLSEHRRQEISEPQNH